MSYLAEQEAALKQSASMQEESSHVQQEAQVSDDDRAEAQCDFFAEAFTTGVPMFGAQGSPFSVDASTCAATQHDGVSPAAPFRCANAPADEDMTPGRSPDHKRKATAQDSTSKLIAVEEDEGDIAATPVRHAPEKRSSRSNPADLNPGLLGVPFGRGSGLDGPPTLPARFGNRRNPRSRISAKFSRQDWTSSPLSPVQPHPLPPINASSLVTRSTPWTQSLPSPLAITLTLRPCHRTLCLSRSSPTLAHRHRSLANSSI